MHGRDMYSCVIRQYIKNCVYSIKVCVIVTAVLGGLVGFWLKCA